jgi:transcriptional regulator with XRE-family HTH domain
MLPWLALALPRSALQRPAATRSGEQPMAAEKTEADRNLFGGLLRTHRAAANLTQEELAERSGLSVHAISMLERGVRRAPRANTVELLAGALKLDASQRELLVAAARGHPEPAAPVRPMMPHDGQPDGDRATRTAPLPRRWLAGRWWLAPALPGLLAALLLIALTVVSVWPWRPAPSPSASSLPLCTTAGHPRGCWATVTDAGISQGSPCPHQVPLYVRAGGHVCLARDVLVEITCYYRGKPSVDGDQLQVHVVAEDGGRLQYGGHIPDRFVNLDHNTPAAVGIGRCSSPSHRPASSPKAA